ncbi:ABC transporter ATP-binding protein [Streptomyces sp. NPDC050617]|uniref:ABC transporter ATP-binding protein n=1 Tax=Streptomyces sp. NPDC050617 TaxID=3154628 RepID=UPI003412D600
MSEARGGRAASPGTYGQGLRFLRRRARVVARLAAWSALETGQTFVMGFALARALDEGFLAGRSGVGLGWLGLAALAVTVGAYGTGRVYRAVAALVEPLRDALVRRVVTRALDDADSAAVSRLTHQVEIARDTFAGLVMVARSFVFTAAGALIGLSSLAPVLLLIVVPPLVLGLALFAATLRPMARRQETFLAADEAIAEEFGTVADGLRDITAAGAESLVAAEADIRIEAEFRAARTLARWGVLRVLAVALAGRFPIVLLIVTAPWLLDRGVTPGALVGALSYLTTSLLPALQNLMHGLGTSGSRLVVVVRRLTAGGPVRLSGGRGRADGGEASRRWEGPAVELRAVTFAYGEHARPVVRDLDLTVPAGGHLAVVGPSGIGKSTLAGLIAGLLEPRAGEVRVGGEPVRAGGDPGRRVLIPQEAYVFTGTLRANLSYLRADPVPDTELAAAVDAVGLGELADRIGGLAAVVDPAGLSAGQRQLIALARAYLSPAPVAVLDEATCHLDPAAEARAERAFARRPGGTLIVIAHRVSSAHRADRILIMDGPQTLCGTHEELLSRSDLYRALTGNWSTGGNGAASAPERPRPGAAHAPPPPAVTTSAPAPPRR